MNISGALLLGALLHEMRRRERAVGGAGIARGAQNVGDLASGGHPFGDDAAGADLRVVGVGEDDHGAVGNLGHDLEWDLHERDSSSVREIVATCVTQSRFS